MNDETLVVGGLLKDALKGVLDECPALCGEQLEGLLRACQQATLDYEQASSATLKIKFIMDADGVLACSVVLSSDRPTSNVTEKVKFADTGDVHMTDLLGRAP